MNPPPNPHAAAARAAMQAQFAAVEAARRAERKEAPLYPLDERRAVWRYVANDCGIDVVIDDPANLFSGW